MDIETALISFVNDGVLSGKSRFTLQAYQRSVSSLVKYIKLSFHTQDLKSIDRSLLEHYFIHGLRIKGWNKFTHWTMFKNLNVFFKWCAHRDFIQSNPLDTLPKPKMPPSYPKSLSENEVRQLLNIVSTAPHRYHFLKVRNKAIVATLLYTGLRKSELLDLEFADVDMDNGILFVRHGKGDKSREIPIQEAVLRPILAEYIGYREKLGKTSRWFFNGILTNKSADDNKLSSATFNELFWNLSRKIKKRVHAHMLRHTFATLLLEKTGDIYVLKELMGHSNIRTTTIYLSASRKKKTEVINKL